jgi:5'-3' exonuclease
VPPLWQWLRDYLVAHSLPQFPNEIKVRGADILPVEQLSLVLPLESWSLIPPCPQKQLPKYAPYLFPTSFSFESVGKRFFWECESMIPLPSIFEVKQIIKTYT